MLLYVHRSHARLIRDGEQGGSGSLFGYFYLSSLKTEETASHCQNNNVKQVGTTSVRSILCTPQLAPLTTVRHTVTKTEYEGSPVEDQLSSQTIHPALRAQFHLPALDLSWALHLPGSGCHSVYLTDLTDPSIPTRLGLQSYIVVS